MKTKDCPKFILHRKEGGCIINASLSTKRHRIFFLKQTPVTQKIQHIVLKTINKQKHCIAEYNFFMNIDRKNQHLKKNQYLFTTDPSI